MSTPPERRRKRCSICGELGHNKAACPAAAEMAPLRKNTVTCSQCGKPGHNSRSCPEKPRSTTVTCSLCGRDGHNCRTCPLRQAQAKKARGEGAGGSGGGGSGGGRPAPPARAAGEGGSASLHLVQGSFPTGQAGTVPGGSGRPRDPFVDGPIDPATFRSRSYPAPAHFDSARDGDDTQAPGGHRSSGTDAAGGSVTSGSGRGGAGILAAGVPAGGAGGPLRFSQALPDYTTPLQDGALLGSPQPNGAAVPAVASAAQRAGQLFGAGLYMEASEDPYALGPVNPDINFPHPESVEDAVRLAYTACYRAWLDKEKKQWVEWLLPATNPRDPSQPMSTEQQFNTAVRLTEHMLKALKANDGLRGPLKAHLFNGSTAEPVGKWEGDSIAAVIFPTAEYSELLQDLVVGGAPERLVLYVNPQWTLEGNVVSDFGLGAPGQLRRSFVESFTPTFFFRRASVNGDRVTVMRVYPGTWQVYYTPQAQGARPELIAADYRRPSFTRLQELLQQQRGSRTAMNWLERMRNPTTVAPLNWPGPSYGGGGGPGGGRGGGYGGSDTSIGRDASSDLDARGGGAGPAGAALPTFSTGLSNQATGERFGLALDWSRRQASSEGGGGGADEGGLPLVQGAPPPTWPGHGYDGGYGRGGPLAQHAARPPQQVAAAALPRIDDASEMQAALAGLTGEGDGDSSNSGTPNERPGSDAAAEGRAGPFAAAQPQAEWGGAPALPTRAPLVDRPGESREGRLQRLQRHLAQVNASIHALAGERTAVLTEIARLSGRSLDELLADEAFRRESLYPEPTLAAHDPLATLLTEIGGGSSGGHGRQGNATEEVGVMWPHAAVEAEAAEGQLEPETAGGDRV